MDQSRRSILMAAQLCALGMNEMNRVREAPQQTTEDGPSRPRSMWHYSRSQGEREYLNRTSEEERKKKKRERQARKKNRS